MTDPTTRQILVQLAAQQHELVTLRALVAARHRGRRRRASRLLPALLLAFLVALVPLGVLADFAFLDLDPASPHNDNIAAIKGAGITKGCDPPTYVNYCPKDTVTREEMASFLARTAGLGGNPPVVNAKSAVTAQTAASADTLGGRGGDGLVRVAFGRSTIVGNFTNQPNIPALSNAGLDIATLTIATPGPGFILINATGEAFTDTVSGCPCTVYSRLLDRSADTPAPASQDVENTLPNHPPGLFGSAALANTHVFAVTAAGTRTYTFNVARIDGGTAKIGANGSLTALFVPFGYNGGTTLAP